MTDDRHTDLPLDLSDADAGWLRSVSRHHPLDGVPRADQARDRVLTFRSLQQAAPELAARVRAAVLGPAWWGDVDVAETPVDDLADRMTVRRLDVLFARIGSQATGTSEYAVIEDDRVVGRVDLAEATGLTPLDRLQQRVRRRLGPDVRDVLELRVLTSHSPIEHHDSALAEIARLEAVLSKPHGDATTVLDAHRTAGPVAAVRRSSWALRRTQRSLRRWLRRPYVIALTGVDGSGKSSSARLVIQYLQRIGIDCGSVWSRPGNRMEWTEGILVRLGLRERGSAPGVAAVASGDDRELSSRKGVVGWIWVLLVTGTFLFDVWRQFLRQRGARVIVFDRHVVDALVTLDFVYAGVDLTVGRWLCRCLPRADITFYLATDPATATARKPGDTFGLYAVTSQLERYDAELARRTGIIVVPDAESPEQRALRVFDHLAGHPHDAGRAGDAGSAR